MLILEDISQFCKFLIPEKASVLVVGSNAGELLPDLKPARSLAIDLGDAGLGAAFDELEERDEKFDFLILVRIVPFLKDIQHTLTRLKRRSHPGTRLVILNPSYLWVPALTALDFLRARPRGQNLSWLSPYDILCLLDLSGYELIRQGSRLLFPFKIPFLAAFLNSFVAKLPLINKLCFTQYYVARPRDPLPIQDHFVSVVVPARNEKGNIEKIVNQMPRVGKQMEIVFGEGNSKDGTFEEIHRVREKYKKEWEIQAVQQTGEGKADAVWKGFGVARGDILMILDADLTTPAEELPKFYEALVTGKGEFVMGSRLVYPLEKDSMRFLNILGNKFFSLLLTWILEVPIKDTLCGTKVLFRRTYDLICRGRSYFGDFDPFGDFDLIFGSAKLQLKILEIPVRYQARSYGQTNIRRFYHAWLLLKTSAFGFQKFKLI